MIRFRTTIYIVCEKMLACRDFSLTVTFVGALGGVDSPSPLISACITYFLFW